jgi:hypothetical protein
MEPSKAAMKAALRVLTALSEHHEPDPSDVDELQWYAPAARKRPIDELVCDAIQRAMVDRQERRKAVQVQLRERAIALSSSASASGLMSHEERDGEKWRLIREAHERRQEYLALSAKLERLGVALQQAAHVMAADAASSPANSEAAKQMLQSVAGDVDVSGITQLLNEHVRLTKHLVADEQTLKEYGIE